MAAAGGHLDIFEFLLSMERKDCNQRNTLGETPLYIAAAQGHLKIVKFLLDQPDIDRNPIFLNRRRVAWAARNGCIINEAPEALKIIGGETPLHAAVVNGNFEIVDYFLGLDDIDIYQIDSEGNRLLHLAAVHGHLNVAELLLRKGKFYIDQTNYKLRTPLHEATKNGHLDIVGCLLSHGADVTQLDSDGHNSLHYLLVSPANLPLTNKHIELAKTLILIDALDAPGNDMGMLYRPHPKQGLALPDVLSKELLHELNTWHEQRFHMANKMLIKNSPLTLFAACKRVERTRSNFTDCTIQSTNESSLQNGHDHKSQRNEIKPLRMPSIG